MSGPTLRFYDWKTHGLDVGPPAQRGRGGVTSLTVYSSSNAPVPAPTFTVVSHVRCGGPGCPYCGLWSSTITGPRGPTGHRGPTGPPGPLAEPPYPVGSFVWAQRERLRPVFQGVVLRFTERGLVLLRLIHEIPWLPDGCRNLVEVHPTLLERPSLLERLVWDYDPPFRKGFRTPFSPSKLRSLIFWPKLRVGRRR